MKLAERGLERFSQMHPQRQKAVEYFAFSGFAAAIAGVSVVPLIEGGTSGGVGLLGIVGGALISVIEWKWGWGSLKTARQNT